MDHDPPQIRPDTPAFPNQPTGPRRRWLRALLPLLLLGAGVGAFSLLLSNKPEALPVQKDDAEWLVSTRIVARERLAPTLSLYGRLESPRESTLTAAIEADVVEVLVLEGDSVPAGALLVQLDATDAQLAADQREADAAEIRAQIESERVRHETDQMAYQQEQELLRLAQVAVDRARRLAQTKAGTESSLDAALEEVARRALNLTNRESSMRDHAARLGQLQARLVRAEAALAQAQRNVDRSRITAPFAARITAVTASPGDHVRLGEPLVTLFDRDFVEIRAQIPNRHLESLRRVSADGLSISGYALLEGRTIDISPQRLAAQVETGRGGVDAFFRVNRPEQVPELGRTVTVQLQLPAVDDVIAVPLDALYENERLYKVVDGRLRGVAVERVGDRTTPGGTLALVKSDELRDGDRIIVSQLSNAVDGLPVRIRD